LTVAANVAHLVRMKLWRALKQWRKEAPAVGAPPEFRLETWYRLTGWQKLLLVILRLLAYVLCVGPTFSSNVLPHMLTSVNAEGHNGEHGGVQCTTLALFDYTFWIKIVANHRRQRQAAVLPGR